MKEKTKLIITVAVIIALFVGVYILYGILSDKNAPDRIAVNETNKNTAVNAEKKEYSVDNFTVYDAEGNRVELWDCIGKPLILNFWASWCGPCKSEIPHFETAYAENPDITFMMVNIDEIKSNGEEYIKSQGFTFPVYYDVTGEASEKYGIIYIPTTFLIDKNGELVGTVEGSMSKDDLSRCISIVKGEEELVIQ